MLTLTLRNLAARKIRLVMSAFAIVLGIAFLAGSFVFTDTLERTFDGIFADEPTGNLDSTSGAEVLGFLRRCVDEFDQTIVMVTHDAGAAAYADRALLINDGRLVGDLDHPDAASIRLELSQVGA